LNDTLPYKYSDTLSNGTDRAKHETFFFYDNLSRLKSDSFYTKLYSAPSNTLTSVHTTSDKFTFSTNKAFGFRKTTSINFPGGFNNIELVYDTSTINASGNVAANTKSKFDNLGTLIRKTNATATYNSTSLPLVMPINNSTAGFPEYALAQQYFQPSPSKNYAISLNEDVIYDAYGLNSFFHSTISYSFLPNGYLSQMLVNIMGQQTKQYKYVYIYKTL
jgi:hypothetical protein